jgi:hypothetical protein
LTLELRAVRCRSAVGARERRWVARLELSVGCGIVAVMKWIAAVSVGVPTVLLVGCGTAVADVPVGPGPTNYVVEAQPAAGSCHYRTAASGQILPDPACTPGAISPKVTEETLDTTICRPGYTKSIRPPRDITEAEKRGSAAAYGYSGRLSDVEYDHLIPLSLGGDPNDPRNLWVEPGGSPNPKDDIEVRLARLVCARTVPLAAAQQAIATDWTSALTSVG